MGNQIPFYNNNNDPSDSPKSIEELFSNAWPILQKTLAEEHIELTPLMKLNFIELIKKDQINYGLGAMFGAFIGDALGSYLQFQTKISSNYADEAMEMPGSGRAFPFLLPGMFTDDSELASHMLKALLNYDPSKTLKQQESSLLFSIAYEYNRWFKSCPFDIGHTTRAAMRFINNTFGQMEITDLQNHKQLFFDSQIKLTLEHIAQKNKSSESNGSLMRITPMAFFISLVMENTLNSNENQFKDFHNLVRNQINMTHGSQAIYQTSEAYVDLLVSLIRRKEDKLQKVQTQFEEKYTSRGNEASNQSIKHVEEWIQDSKLKPPSAINSMGWAKIAFTQTLITLRKLREMQQKSQKFMNPETYKALIRSVLILGGDTDTNGAIVGGLIGAIVGFKKLPLEYLKKQFELKMSEIKKSKDWLSKRTEYEPHRVFLNAIKMIQKFYPEIKLGNEQRLQKPKGNQQIEERMYIKEIEQETMKQGANQRQDNKQTTIQKAKPKQVQRFDLE